MKWNEIFVNQQRERFFACRFDFFPSVFRRNESVARNFSPRLLLTLYKRGKNLQSITSLIRVLWFSSLQTSTCACASLPLVVRFIFVWIPREKPRVNLAAFRVSVWQTEGEGEKVAGESWGRNKGGRERERADKSGLKGGTSDGEQKVWKESSSRKARKVGHFTFARTSSPSALCQQLCLLVTDVVAYVYLYKHTRTLCKQTPVPKT